MELAAYSPLSELLNAALGHHVNTISALALC